MEPAPVGAELSRDGVDERGEVVVRLALDLGDALRRRRRRRARGSRATASAGTTPSSAQASSAASSTSSQRSSLLSSDQTLAISGRE